MRKVIFPLSMSLDRYFEGTGRELDWHSVDEEPHQHFSDLLAPMSVFIDGRVNCELTASYQPHADEDPSATAQEREFARIWRDMPKLVYSRTLRHIDWHGAIVREVVPEDIQRLKQQPGGDMVVRGSNLAANFARYGLIHEDRIYLQPVVLGAGRPLGQDVTAERSVAGVRSPRRRDRQAQSALHRPRLRPPASAERYRKRRGASMWRPSCYRSIDVRDALAGSGKQFLRCVVTRVSRCCVPTVRDVTNAPELCASNVLAFMAGRGWQSGGTTGQPDLRALFARRAPSQLDGGE